MNKSIRSDKNLSVHKIKQRIRKGATINIKSILVRIS